MQSKEKIRILYLEDERLLWELFIAACTNETSSIVCASTTNECIMMLKNNFHIDLVVTDYHLVGHTCQGFLDYMTETNRMIPTIVYSSLPEADLRHLVKYEEVITFIEKPDASGLRECINAFQKEHLR